MFGPITTAGRIDAFESRFTIANGAHFLITPDGKEAWPLSEEEARDFRALYRRRMERARLIRRVALIAFLPLTVVIGSNMPEAPRWLRTAVQALQLFTLFALPMAALIQHRITGDLTEAAVARPLKRRITTRFEPAVTPPATPLGRFAKRLLFAGGVIEVALIAGHLLFTRDHLAAHLRVLYGLASGNEGPFAHFTGNLAWITLLAMLAAAVLMVLDRRNRRLDRATEAENRPKRPKGG